MFLRRAPHLSLTKRILEHEWYKTIQSLNYKNPQMYQYLKTHRSAEWKAVKTHLQSILSATVLNDIQLQVKTQQYWTQLMVLNDIQSDQNRAILNVTVLNSIQSQIKTEKNKIAHVLEDARYWTTNTIYGPRHISLSKIKKNWWFLS